MSIMYKTTVMTQCSLRRLWCQCSSRLLRCMHYKKYEQLCDVSNYSHAGRSMVYIGQTRLQYSEDPILSEPSSRSQIFAQQLAESLEPKKALE
eukprot:768727-Hanusia_phi.AAC.4